MRFIFRVFCIQVFVAALVGAAWAGTAGFQQGLAAVAGGAVAATFNALSGVVTVHHLMARAKHPVAVLLRAHAVKWVLMATLLAMVIAKQALGALPFVAGFVAAMFGGLFALLCQDQRKSYKDGGR